jgi:hypothetical protein
LDEGRNEPGWTGAPEEGEDGFRGLADGCAGRGCNDCEGGIGDEPLRPELAGVRMITPREGAGDGVVGFAEAGAPPGAGVASTRGPVAGAGNARRAAGADGVAAGGFPVSVRGAGARELPPEFNWRFPADGEGVALGAREPVGSARREGGATRGLTEDSAGRPLVSLWGAAARAGAETASREVGGKPADSVAAGPEDRDRTATLAEGVGVPERPLRVTASGVLDPVSALT